MKGGGVTKTGLDRGAQGGLGISEGGGVACVCVGLAPPSFVLNRRQLDRPSEPICFFHPLHNPQPSAKHVAMRLAPAPERGVDGGPPPSPLAVL